MLNPEQPKPIEKQRELYKLPKEKIDLLALPSGSAKIDTSLDRALRTILSVTERDSKKVSLQIAEIEAKAVRAGFDTSLARPGTLVALENGALYLNLKREKKGYAVKLNKDATIKAGYIEVKPGAVVKSRRAWESLKEAFEHGVVSEILAALGGGDRRAGAFENRSRIWKEIMGKSERFRGTAEQNRAIIDYVKTELAAGRTPDIAPKPAPAEEKKARGRREKEGRKREERWPRKDQYVEYLRKHPATPEAPDPLKEAIHKVKVLLGPRLDEIDDRIEMALMRVGIARINMSGTGLADAKMTRGSIKAATRAVGQVKDAIGKFRRESQDLMETLTKVKNDIREKGGHPQQTASIERSKTALQDTMNELDDQYLTATNMELELAKFLEKTKIRPTNE